MKANVGCGAEYWGDIRVDVSKDHWMTMGKSSANMIADARYLPFRGKCFDELRIHQALEHIQDWKKALYERCRVTKKISITIPVNSYMPRQYINWFLPTLTNLRYLLSVPKLAYLKHVLRLRKRTREHLWQFDISTLTSMIRKLGFHNIQVDTIYNPIFAFKGKYFRCVNERFKKANSWEIVAF